MVPVDHNILFKTEQVYNKACELLSVPITMGRRPRRYEVVLLSATGTHIGPDGRHAMWLNTMVERHAEYWELIQKVLEPLNPYYTGDVQEIAEFIGRR